MRSKFYAGAALFVALVSIGTGVAYALSVRNEKSNSASCCPDGACCPDGPCCAVGGCCPDGPCCPYGPCCKEATATASCCPDGACCPNGPCCSTESVKAKCCSSSADGVATAEGFDCPLTGEKLPCPKCCPLNKGE
jgi:hypothetical protein